MTTFQITINPFKAPFMREKQIPVNTVCKYRDGSTYRYSHYRYGKESCGRVMRYTDTCETIEERERYMVGFDKKIQRAFDKAVIRFHKHYAGINYQDEIIDTYMPYPHLTDATKNVMSDYWLAYNKDREFLQSIVSRLRIKWIQVMSLAQQGKYKQISDALYHVHVYYLELSSLCRPCNQEVVYKGDNDPLLANRS